MKLHFEPDLDYQHAAIAAVADLFCGQESCRTVFTVTAARDAAAPLMPGLEQNDLGIGNRRQLLDEELLANLQGIQIRNGLPPAGVLASTDFTVEMETGTGKTYVYLRTIFELNRRYGFTKFVIVVPSVAIKEGVYKSLQIMAEHFRGLYTNVPFEYFLYDSGKLGQVRNFATSPHIQIMVVTVGAINKKDVNNLYKDSEKTGGEKPIDLVRATRPILIVDEPQSVDGGLSGAGKEALGAMNALCTLRYSATHVDKHHMLYRLDAVDAYQKRLVKQIEVASLTADGGHNQPYIKLIRVRNDGGGVVATAELDVEKRTKNGGKVTRKEVKLRAGDDLADVTGRALYANCRVQNLGCAEGAEFMQLSNAEQPLRPGDALGGGVPDDALKRLMIRRAIEEHLRKEMHLAPRGIKVLSLFFIDVVEYYRSYAADGTPIKGKYATMFEEEYRAAAARPEFQSLFKEVDTHSLATEVHDGYFSIDKKGRLTDTREGEGNQTERDNAERAYTLIMKDKERLLSFDTKLKFIFSHSALREGWDNPNVFQIAVLRDMGSELARRQSIGRGLRLCVDQQGARVRGDVNVLTVVATESYQNFADTLQKEIEADTGIRFGMVENHQFAGLAVQAEDGHTAALGVEGSKRLWAHLHAAGHLSVSGKVQDSLRIALKNGTLALPEEFELLRPQVTDLLRKLAGRLEVRNADERRTVKPRKEVLHGPEFRELWERIKHKTTYRVQFDNPKLMADCAKAIQNGPPITPPRVHVEKATVAIDRSGVTAKGTETSAPLVVDDPRMELPDILTFMQDATQLTRRSLAEILTRSERLPDFLLNPQGFIELATECINRAKRLALVDGIKYQRLGSESYYAQELFENEELTGYLKNLLDAKKSVFEKVVCDSDPERNFAEQLEKNTAIKLYAKLPGWFVVPTPLGGYNPDWAVLVETVAGERLYFVVETKSSLFTDDLRDVESGKIRCGKAHFDALRATVKQPFAQFVPAKNLNDVFSATRS